MDTTTSADQTGITLQFKKKKGAGNCEVDSDTNKGVNIYWMLLVGAR